MVNRMVFFCVYVIAERFTSDFVESLLPELFSPTEPKNTPIYMTSFLKNKKRERLRRKLSLRHSLFSAYEINDFIPRILFLVESQVNIHGTCHRASYHGVVADTQEAHHLHVCGDR